MDVSEADGKLVVRAELPGVGKDDVEVALTDDVPTIRGEKKQEESREEGEMHVRERSYGSFRRSFALPCRVAEHQVTAAFKTGVLTVTLPRVEAPAGKKIQITG